MTGKQGKAPREPLLEWIAASVGLFLTLGLLGVIAREALSGETEEPPAIEVRAGAVRTVPNGFLVEVVAVNRSGGTGAAVTIEGELKAGQASVETSSFALDYVPGHSQRRGGLFFSRDPRRHALEVRALGYQLP